MDAPAGDTPARIKGAAREQLAPGAGGIDSIHTSFLHRKFAGNRAGLGGLRAAATAAKLEVRNTRYGYTYASIRPLGEGKGNYVRTYHWVMPHHQIRAIQEYTEDGTQPKFKIAGHVWVPAYPVLGRGIELQDRRARVGASGR